MRDGEGLRLVPSTRHGGARRHLRPVSGCDSSVMCCGPDHVPNSAAAARNGQSGICRHRDEDVSIIENHKIQAQSHPTGKKTPGGAGTHTGHTGHTGAHAGTRITRTNLTTIHPNPSGHKPTGTSEKIF